MFYKEIRGLDPYDMWHQPVLMCVYACMAQKMIFQYYLKEWADF